jgi:hypothetical protein
MYATEALPIPAWHNNPQLKAETVARMEAHRAEDSIIHLVYQRSAPDLATGFRGCAVGCALPKVPSLGGLRCQECGLSACSGNCNGTGVDWHSRWAEELGVHAVVARAIDYTFEWIPWPDSSDFAVAVVKAIPVGADLRGVVRELRDRPPWRGVYRASGAAARLIDLLANAPVLIDPKAS